MRPNRHLIRRYVRILCSVVIIMLAVLYAYWVTHPDVMMVQYAYDVTDDRILAGAADNIFVGRVSQQAGQQRTGASPETQFLVQVEESIKGDLPQVVLVNQLGGRRWGHLTHVQGESLIEPGKVYLFVARCNQAGDYHTLVPVYGRLEITDDLERQQLVARFQAAFQSQIGSPFTP